MTYAAKTVYYFGFYLFLTGLTLIFAPNLLLSTFGFEPTAEVWIRVVGALTFGIGLYYTFTARTSHEPFLLVTVYARLLIGFWFALFVAMGWAKAQIMLFGGVDVAGALWTWLALKKR